MPDGTDFDGSAVQRWEWSADEIRRVGHQVVELIAQHLTELPDAPVFRPFPNERARSMLDEPLPEHGVPAGEILERCAAEVLPYPFGNGHPRCAGWINGPPVVISVLAEALAAAMNPSVAGGNHAATYVERQVVAWLKPMVGYPADAMGLLVSGASAATITGPSYLRQDADPHGVTWLPWLSEYGVEQTRSFRALKNWMALLYHGRSGCAIDLPRQPPAPIGSPTGFRMGRARLAQKSAWVADRTGWRTREGVARCPSRVAHRVSRPSIGAISSADSSKSNTLMFSAMRVGLVDSAAT